MICVRILISAFIMAASLLAQTPENLVVEGIPPFTTELRGDAARYLEFRAAGFIAWHPVRREMLIATRFADTLQLHSVAQPRGARRQITFSSEPVERGLFEPKTGSFLIFSQDTGGGEFHQLHRLDLADGRVTLLTDGLSRNSNPRFSGDGRWLFFNSTRRSGKDTDLWCMDPRHPESAKLVLKVSGGGWALLDVNGDGLRVLVQNRRSINDSELYFLNVTLGSLTRLTPESDRKVSYNSARLTRDGKSVICTTDKESEFLRLARLDLTTCLLSILTPELKWDIESFDLSPDGKSVAFAINEEGISRLKFFDFKTRTIKHGPPLPSGVLSGLEWHDTGGDIGFSLTYAQSPTDAYSLEVKSGKVTRWTESETGGLDPKIFQQPELIRTPSFDGLSISAFVYRPDPSRFPGPRPSLVLIHGGPESQSRPLFQARYNYLINELGIALVVPNVRGSAGYGKTFLTLDDGFKREDSVRDIGTFLDWIANDSGLDAARVAVMGGSYGGYMTLASLVMYGERFKCGVDIVGISNFVTFLTHTQDYRRDLRRVEYGDERDPKMRTHLEQISPLNNVSKIRAPLFVVQGKNDPRVPLSEAEQMVKAVREKGGICWYLMAKDEGHGFAKKRNVDFQFLSTLLFLKAHLLH